MRWHNMAHDAEPPVNAMSGNDLIPLLEPPLYGDDINTTIVAVHEPFVTLRVDHRAEPGQLAGIRPGLADSQRLCFELATASDVDLTTDRPVPVNLGQIGLLRASPPWRRWLRVNTINHWISPRWASSSATGMEPQTRYAAGFTPLWVTAVDLNHEGKMSPRGV
jgi:hypothetical protein